MDINWAAWAPVIVIILGFIIYCIVDIARHDVRYLPKWAWVVICCSSFPMGVIAYFLLGRDPGSLK